MMSHEFAQGGQNRFQGGQCPALPQLRNAKIGPKDDGKKTINQKIFNKVIWYIGTARNFIVVMLSALISYFLIENGFGHLLKTIGDVPQGLPEFNLPKFYVPEIKNASGYIIQEEQTFYDVIAYMNIGLLAVPLIALIETISINKVSAKGKPVDPTQELLAIGSSALLNSFVGAYPGNGSFSRGAINRESGAMTPMGSLYSGILVIVALLYFTPYFKYIPHSSLAAVIMAAVIFMIEYQVIRPLWGTKKIDLIPGLTCFFCCLLLGIPSGTFIGIGVNILFILYDAARPKIQIERRRTPNGAKFILIKPDRCLIFPSVDYVRHLINKQGIQQQLPVVIDCTCVYGADYTSAKVIEMLLNDFSEREQSIFFLNLKPSVAEIFEGAELDMHVFYTLHAMEMMIEEQMKNDELMTKL